MPGGGQDGQQDGQQDGPNYDNADAKRDATFQGLIGGGLKVLDFFGNRKKVARKNAAIRQDHADRVFAYKVKFNNDVIAWQNANLDSDNEVRSKYRQAVDEIAKTNLSIFNGLRDTTNAQVAAWAKMMTVGHTGQAGKRAGGTGARVALLKYALESQQLAAKMSGKIAEASLASSLKMNQTDDSVWNADIKQAMGRPIPGTPPRLNQNELLQNDSFAKLALGLGSTWLDTRKTYRALEAESPYENTNTGNVQQDPPPPPAPAEEDTFNIDGAVGDFGPFTNRNSYLL